LVRNIMNAESNLTAVRNQIRISLGCWYRLQHINTLPKERVYLCLLINTMRFVHAL